MSQQVGLKVVCEVEHNLLCIVHIINACIRETLNNFNLRLEVRKWGAISAEPSAKSSSPICESTSMRGRIIANRQRQESLPLVNHMKKIYIYPVGSRNG